MRSLFPKTFKITPRAIAIALMILGIILIAYARHSMQKVEEAKNTIHSVSDFFTNNTGIWNPMIKFFGGKANEEASKYDLTLSTLLIIGIVMTILGLVCFFWYRKK